MNSIQKRFIAFIFGCILVRTLFVIFVKKISNKYLPYLGYIAIIPAIGFLIIYFGGYRKFGPETLGKKIWWNDLRPIHALLYLMFAYLAINKKSESYIPLLIDVIIGLIAFLYFHYTDGSFNKLF